MFQNVYEFQYILREFSASIVGGNEELSIFVAELFYIGKTIFSMLWFRDSGSRQRCPILAKSRIFCFKRPQEKSVSNLF